jgi:ADP-ribose pyrophosphatase
MDKVLQAQDIWSNPVMAIEEYELLSDKTHTPYRRGVVRVQDAVAVLAVNADDDYVFVQQPRFAVREDRLLELIAGKIDKGESPLAAAMRETEEETGMVAATLAPLGTYFPSPAYLTETIHLFFARLIAGGERGGDDILSVDPVVVPQVELMHMIRRGMIQDGKLLAALGARQIIYGEGL